MSRNEPTGTWRASVSGTKVSPFWLARAPAVAVPAGTPISTGPSPAGPMFTSSPIVGSGRSSSVCAATVKDTVVAGPTLPAASRARTAKVCGPAGSNGVVKGEEQSTKGPPSTLHWKVEPASFELNSNVGELTLVVPVGPPVIAAFGGVVSGGGGVVTLALGGDGGGVGGRGDVDGVGHPCWTGW